MKSLGAGVEIRQESVDDEPAVAAVIAAAFAQPDEAGLVRSLRADSSWVPQLSLVAIDSEEVVGHIAFSRLAIGTGVGVALAPLSVAPARQQQGVGSALTRYGLKRAEELGYGTVVVLGDPGFYKRFGFVRASTLNIIGPFGDIEEFQALRLGAEPPLTGRVRYAAPFDIAD